MALSGMAILVIDVQRYYTELTSPLVTFTETLHRGGTDYIQRRLDTVVIPNINRILAAARTSDVPIIYARLCGTRDDRSDLHRNFREFDQNAYEQAGIHVYPLATEPLAGIDLRIAPLPGDTIIDKTSYSAFHATGLHQMLSSMNIKQLVITGLTTSQCVNSTARAASDYGYITHMVGDAQADYELNDHNAALYASEPITGRAVSTSDVLSLLATLTQND
jgi:nicotinamidase-related amidase